MTLLTELEARQVAEAISEVERRTDAELVAVLARQADDYRYIPTLWAALVALVSPGIILFLPFWLEVAEVLVVQLIVFVLMVLILRFPPVMRRIIPSSVRNWRASNLARRQFLENNLHHTKGETGVLIFVSEVERYVEIIADRGVTPFVSDSDWEEVVNDFTRLVHEGKTLEGFLHTVEKCGNLLAEHIPATSEKDELPNHLILL
jgi:putative membrane protein